MRPVYYVERNGIPVAVDDSTDAERILRDVSARTVAKTYRGDGAVMISTMFMVVDHNFWGSEPILYETMIFWPGHEFDEWQDRYATRDEAKAGHDAAVALVDGTIMEMSK